MSRTSSRASAAEARAHAEPSIKKPSNSRTGGIASFVLELRTYWVNGRRPREGERHAEAVAAEAKADEPEQSQRSQVEGDRRGMSRGQCVPLSAPPEQQVRGHVGDVRDRPVRVAALVGRLAAPVRLDVAHLAVGVRLAARSERIVRAGSVRTATARWRCGARRPARVATSITFGFGCVTLSPIRKPTRKTVAAASSQTGQTGCPDTSVRPRKPIHVMRASRYTSGGYASGAS